MKWRPVWSDFSVTPIVVGGIAAGVLIAFAAAWHNIRLANATEQVLSTVAAAREMDFEPELKPEAATMRLSEKLSRSLPIRAVAQEAFPNAGAQLWGYENPWGKLAAFAVFPSARQLKMVSPMPASACRRLLMSLARDIGNIGVLKVDARDEQPPFLWRNIYSIDGTPPLHAEAKLLGDEAIKTGCGRSRIVNLSLSFALR